MLKTKIDPTPIANWLPIEKLAIELNIKPGTLSWRIDYFNAEFPDSVVGINDSEISPQGCTLAKQMEEYLQGEDANMKGFVTMLRHQEIAEEVIPADPVLLFETQDRDIIDVSIPTEQAEVITTSGDFVTETPQASLGQEFSVFGGPDELVIPSSSAVTADGYVPNALVRKLDDFFAYNDRFLGYAIFEYIALHKPKWGLTSNEIEQLIEIRPRKKIIYYDSFVLVRSKKKTTFRDRTTHKVSTVYTWRVMTVKNYKQWKSDKKRRKKKKKAMKNFNVPLTSNHAKSPRHS